MQRIWLSQLSVQLNLYCTAVGGSHWDMVGMAGNVPELPICEKWKVLCTSKPQLCQLLKH